MVDEPNTQDVDLGSDGEDEELPSIEQKYQSQMRQIVTQRLDLPVSAMPAMLKDQIKLNPDFQRRDRWDEKRQSRLIESLLMNVPIPPVFLGEDEYGQYVVLDGRQRLTAVAKFLSNDLKLRDLEVWNDLNGQSYQDLVKRQQDKYLTRRFIPAVVILKESSSVVKYDVFDRLNTGGIKANNMEIRNAVYRGKFTELLHKLSRTSEFCELWGIPQDVIKAAEDSNLYQQMLDVEATLRFFALREPQKMRVRFADYLSEYLEERNQQYKDNSAHEAEDTLIFERAVQNAKRVLGVEAFFKRSTKKAERSFPVADAIMVAFSTVDPAQITNDKADKIKAAVQELFENADFLKSISSGTNGRGAIKNRVGMATRAVHAALA